MKRDMHTYAEIGPAEMYRFPRSMGEAFGPHCSNHIESELIAPPWSVNDLLGGLLLFVVAALLLGVAVARWLA